jgi:hypothetical protein
MVLVQICVSCDINVNANVNSGNALNAPDLLNCKQLLSRTSRGCEARQGFAKLGEVN